MALEPIPGFFGSLIFGYLKNTTFIFFWKNLCYRRLSGDILPKFSVWGNNGFSAKRDLEVGTKELNFSVVFTHLGTDDGSK